jgi:hypothetical protein
MVFVNSSGPIPAPDFSFPDVCTTPVGPVPVPIPYPNIALAPTAIPTQFTTFLTCMPAHNLLTTKPMSLGDQPGVLLGVASGFVMGPVKHVMGSVTLLIGGPPTTKMLNPTSQNGMSPNIVGMTIAPTQVTTICLS